jgi:hypothetical protein
MLADIVPSLFDQRVVLTTSVGSATDGVCSTSRGAHVCPRGQPMNHSRPVRPATPSPRRTSTAHLLPVSRRTASDDVHLYKTLRSIDVADAMALYL